MTKRNDLIFGGVILLLSIFYIWQAFQFPPGDHFLNSSRSFPILLGTVVLFLSLSLIIRTIKTNQNKSESTFTKRASLRGIFYILWTAIFIFLLIPLIGFGVAAVLYIIISLGYYKEVKWYTVILVSIGTILFIYFVFNQLLHIRLPS